MATLLSTVVIAFLAAPVLNAVFSTSARAADSCLARPTGSPPNGSHWYYQTNRITHQRCWVLGAKKTIVRNIASQKFSGLAKDSEPTERAPAVSCITPNSQPPQGKRWYYRTDKATGQRCWHLGAKVSKISNPIPAPSPSPVKLVAPETLATVLPPAVADANARFEDTFVALRSQTAAVTAEVANENLATSTFASRWIDLSDQVHSTDPQSNPVGHSEIRQPVAAVRDDVTNSTTASGHLYTAERPPNVTLMVFLVSFGVALVFFALLGRSFLYAHPTPPVWPHIPARDDIFRIPSDLDTSGPILADTAKTAGVRPDGVDGRHPDERDLWVAADALLREIGGGSQIDRDLSRGQRPQRVGA
jgi:hypothetical protein